MAGFTPLAGLQGPSKSGLLGGIGSLKHRAEKLKFVDQKWDVSQLSNTSPTHRMRDIDSLRLYTPLLSERQLLKIHESIERLHLHSIHHILIFAGGCVRVRFSSEDMNMIVTIQKNLTESFQILDNHFTNNMTLTAKKRINKVSETGFINIWEMTLTDVERIVIEEEQQIVQSVNTFHLLANNYMENIFELQNLIRRKNESIIDQEDEIEQSKDPDGDMKGANALPQPTWLSTLLGAYKSEGAPLVDIEYRRLAESQGLAVIENRLPSKSTLPSLGRFAAFLSHCLVNDTLQTSIEVSALSELIQASIGMDDIVNVHHANQPKLNEHEISIDNIDNNLISNYDQGIKPIRTQKYWAKRFYAFLKNIPELKTAIKEEKILLKFDTFTL